MEQTYPQEHVGTTLLAVREDDESRRIYMRRHPSYVEVCEFTKGSLTQAVYDAPAHCHSITLEDERAQQLALSFFADQSAFLADFMDYLDGEGIPYGYLSSMMGKYVSYRPATMHTTSGI